MLVYRVASLEIDSCDNIWENEISGIERGSVASCLTYPPLFPLCVVHVNILCVSS